MTLPIDQHNLEIRANYACWQKKPLLRKVYRDFYKLLQKWLAREKAGGTVDIGSGTGRIKEIIPDCLATDLFANPWIDRVENVYALQFADNSLDNVILFDVLHHLQYPGTAFWELKRVLRPSGRVIIFEPAMSLLGLLVYGLLHKEPLGWNRELAWTAPAGFDPQNTAYFAAQSLCHRIFCSRQEQKNINGFTLLFQKRFSALAYLGSGGFNGPQCYPCRLYSFFKSVDKCLTPLPSVFATRMLVILEKNENLS